MSLKIIKLLNNPNRLLNLGNEDARRWLTDHISGMIKKEGIGMYRQDFNMNPLQYWRSADKPDRQGITEIRYVEGLYEFWDELLRRHPSASSYPQPVSEAAILRSTASEA